MCGRYTVVSKLSIIEKEFRVDASEIMERFSVNPNVSPGEQALVITSADPGMIQLFTFGFTPYWAKKKMYVINARSEGDHNKDNDPRYTGAKGILSKPMFRSSIRSKRCLVIADAFVEGTTQERLSRPYLVYRRDKKRPFAMAGIWDEWMDPATGEVVQSFAILTTAPTPLMEQIPHHRSPLVLQEEDEARWLDEELPLSEVTAMLRPFDDADFNAYPIASTIKSARDKDIHNLMPTGDLLRAEYDYIFYQELDLQGMGETSARKRQRNQQLNLFD